MTAMSVELQLPGKVRTWMHVVLATLHFPVTGRHQGGCVCVYFSD